MNKIIFAALVLLTISTNPLAAMLPAADEVEEAGNSTTTTTEAPLLASPRQCLYDFKNKRVNQDCHAEKPPKCEKGSLVQTMNGETYEMCCCNYSNYVTDDQ